MSNFIIAVGHTASGNRGCGVINKLDESNCVREICPFVVEFLEQKGHNVKLLRVDKGNGAYLEDCYTRADQANEIGKYQRVDLYVEIHLNSGGGTGPEVYVTGLSELASLYANSVSSSLATSLNLPNRGVKKGNFIVLNRTVMPAILVECLFVDSQDRDKYNPNVIAKAIVNGLESIDNHNNNWKLGWNKNNIGWWYCTSDINKYYYTSRNGWKYIDGEWYIFDNEGYAIHDSWYYDNNDGHWYYLDSNCKLV